MEVIQKCLKPIRIEDKRNGGYMYVNCGHCDCCRSAYKSMWQQRLDCEASKSAVTLFFTLTYDNEHIPSLTYDFNTNALYSNRTSKDDIYLDDYGLDQYSLMQDFPQIQNYSQINTLGYVSKSDVQKFIKRLRRSLEYDKDCLLTHVSKTSKLFRYFITSEYGPYLS